MGPGKDTPSTLRARIAGKLWVARLDQTADTRQTLYFLNFQVFKIMIVLFFFLLI